MVTDIQGGHEGRWQEKKEEQESNGHFGQKIELVVEFWDEYKLEVEQ